MKEIGGYFGLEAFTGTEYYPELLAVNNGRSALLYLLETRKIKKLYIPHFLCESVSLMCKREGYDYDFYSIDRDFLPVFSQELGEGEYLYVVNYYGQFSDERVRELKRQYGNIILDNVQAFFQRPVPGVDTVYSCRKFFGVPDGGYVSTDVHLERPLELDVSKDRMKHVLGRFEGCASDYYIDFKVSDRAFLDQPLRKMSLLTRNLLRAVDYDAVRRSREENYAVLADGLGARNLLKLQMPVGPYCYPFYCKNGMAVKKMLAQKNIYVATLWPNVLERDGTLEKDYAENILPLPCDQRYGVEDMLHIISEVDACIG